VLVNEARAGGQGIEVFEHGVDMGIADDASARELVEGRSTVGLHAGLREHVCVFHQVACDDAKPPTFESARDAGRPTERINGDTVPDPARTERAADEIEQASLVPDVTHSGEYRGTRIVPSITSESMPHYRVTIRWGAPPRYHLLDLEAADLRRVLKQLPEDLPAQVLATGDLIEIRVQTDPEPREFKPG
jgi:hypothetical protein